jgi:hypothetical protein
MNILTRQALYRVLDTAGIIRKIKVRDRSSYRSDIITVIPVRQPSRIIRPSLLPYLSPLSSEPDAMKGPMIKRNLGLQLGTVFA